MKRVIWDEEEAALLVDTYRRIEAAPSQKNELLHQLSDVLRKRAISKGLEINERFRNFNGMKFQYGALALSDDGWGAGAFWKCSKDDRGNGRDLSE